MSDGYGGGGQWLEKIREAIVAFIKQDAASADGAAELDASIRSLLKQGRKIDAVTLVRTRENLGLTQAVQRVNDVEKRMKAR
jgi:ribosomal protein L7/L12